MLGLGRIEHRHGFGGGGACLVPDWGLGMESVDDGPWVGFSCVAKPKLGRAMQGLLGNHVGTLSASTERSTSAHRDGAGEKAKQYSHES